MKPFSYFKLHILAVLLLGIPGVSFAKPPVKASTELVITDSKGSEFQLEVRQMPMIQVIDMVAHKTHVPIHYSVLPEGLVTATCVGSNLKQVLDCVLDKKADIIVRTSESSASKTKAAATGNVAEAWILGSKMATANSGSGYCVANAEPSVDNLSLTVRESKQSENAELDLANELLKRAQSKNPVERKEAIAELQVAGNKDDPAIKAALEKALTDQNASVRAQAISSLVRREGDGAAGAIQDALRDTSADVRLMAVDAITNDIPLLQQALSDSDETVRVLASLKLGDLNQATNVVQK